VAAVVVHTPKSFRYCSLQPRQKALLQRLKSTKNPFCKQAMACQPQEQSMLIKATMASQPLSKAGKGRCPIQVFLSKTL